MEVVARLASRATRSHTTDAPATLQVHAYCPVLASQAPRREAVGAWKLQTPEEKNADYVSTQTTAVNHWK